MKNLLICTGMFLCLLFPTYPVIADWPTVGQNYQNTFKAVDLLPEGTYVPIWEYAMPTPDFSMASAVITSGDKLFFGIRNYKTGTNTRLQCLDANTHEVVWTFDTCYYLMSNPIVDGDNVYFSMGVIPGTYFQAVSRVYCVDKKDGHLVWQTNQIATCYSSPTVEGDKLIVPRSYSIDNGAAIECFDKYTGVSQWIRGMGNRFGFGEGFLLTLCGDIAVSPFKSYYTPNGPWVGGIFAVDTNNNVLWQKNWPSSSVHRDYNGTTADNENFYIYCSSTWYSQTTNWISCINALTGEVVWEKMVVTPGNKGGQLTLSDTTLYIPIGGKIYCFDKATGIVTQEIAVASSRWISIAGNKLLFTTNGAVRIYDAVSGIVEWMYNIGYGTGAMNTVTIANKSFYSTVGTKIVQFGLDNTSPSSEAGDNLEIQSDQTNTTILYGSASDIDNDALVYRWLLNDQIVQNDTPVPSDGICMLDLSTLPSLPVGQYVFTLEVDDTKATTSDSLVITVGNSPPVVPLSGSSTYSFGSPILMDIQLSDYDGDALGLTWSIDGTVFAESTIQTLPNGEPVAIPAQDIGFLQIGPHTLTLTVSDGTMTSEHTMIINVVDVTAPTLHPQANTSILWPPNHELVDIVIQANAQDDCGHISLAATVSSSEPLNKEGDGNTDFDYTSPVVHEDGTITLQLRSERSGKGIGRTYVITIFASDRSGNVTQAELQIMAPHSKSK